MKSACKASSVTWRSPREVSRETKDTSTDSEKALKSAVPQQPGVHHRGGNKDVNRKRSCSLKTFVERHGAQTKASDVRINLSTTGACVSGMMRRQPIVWQKAFSRGGERSTLPTARTANSFGSLVRMTCHEDAES